MKVITFLLLILIIPMIFLGCKEPTAPEEQTVFIIKSIEATPPIVAKNDRVVLSTDVYFNGQDSKSDILYQWECNQGTFSSSNSQQTIWTAPSTLGNYEIKLTITHAQNKSSGKTTVKVVQTPASGYGCVSGFMEDESGRPITNKTIVLGTGESSKSDTKGYFFLENVPQGSNDIDFPDLGYLWAASYNKDINVLGGHINHLGRIILYTSNAPSIISIKRASGKRIILNWTPSDLNLYQFVDLYQNEVRIRRYSPTITSEILQSDVEGPVSFKLRSIPYHGKLSEFSSSVSSSFVNAIDPPSSTSTFTFQNFYSAILTWQTLDNEQFLSGFRIAYLGSFYWYFLTNLLPSTSHQYTLSTYPGDQTVYFILSIADDGSYNGLQPNTQRLNINTPSLADVTSLTATVSSSPIKTDLNWINITGNDSWYNGYIVERALGSGTTVGSYQQIGVISNITSNSYSDLSAVSKTTYTYKLRSFAVRSQSADTSKSSGVIVVATLP